MADIIISHHTKDDLEAIAAIESVSINPPWSFKAICDFSECDTSRILVAKIDKIVVGYITYSVVLDEVQIANVATHSDFRRKGIGEKILMYLYDEAKEGNMYVITLEVRESNTAARTLYISEGFSEIGARPNYYTNPREAAIIMEKRL